MFYQWTSTTTGDSLMHGGFVAEDVEAIYPEAVGSFTVQKSTATAPEEFKNIDPMAMIARLVMEVQALRKRVAALEKKP